ncbi:MAG: hypothetical protein ACEPOW_14230 [Bacteroidales bacterium]
MEIIELSLIILTIIAPTIASLFPDIIKDMFSFEKFVFISLKVSLISDEIGKKFKSFSGNVKLYNGKKLDEGIVISSVFLNRGKTFIKAGEEITLKINKDYYWESVLITDTGSDVEVTTDIKGSELIFLFNKLFRKQDFIKFEAVIKTHKKSNYEKYASVYEKITVHHQIQTLQKKLGYYLKSNNNNILKGYEFKLIRGLKEQFMQIVTFLFILTFPFSIQDEIFPLLITAIASILYIELYLRYRNLSVEFEDTIIEFAIKTHMKLIFVYVPKILFMVLRFIFQLPKIKQREYYVLNDSDIEKWILFGLIIVACYYFDDFIYPILLSLVSIVLVREALRIISESIQKKKSKEVNGLININ